MNPFVFQTPETLDHALSLLHTHGDEAKLIAGGTALVNMMKQNLVVPETLISLHRLQGLAQVQETNGTIALGGLLTHRAAELSPLLQARLPVLADTFRKVATVRIRNVATLGGALAHADPNQDPPITLLALDAQVQLTSTRGQREVALADFFKDYYETVLAPDELLTEVRVPLPRPHTGSVYLKFLPRSADDYATVGAAVSVQIDPASGVCVDCRIAMGCVGVTPVRSSQAESLVRGQSLSEALLHEVGEVAQQDTDPISDTRGSAAYKRAMARVYVRRALAQAWQQARGETP